MRNFFKDLLKPTNQSISRPGEITFFDGQGNTITIGDSSEITIPAFTQAADLITEQLLSLPIQVLNEQDEVVEGETPITVLENGVRDFMTGYDSKKFLYSHLVRYGDAFAVKQIGGRSRNILTQLIPATIEDYSEVKLTNVRVGNVTRQLPRYKLRRIDESKSRPERYSTKEIVHIKGRNFDGLLSFNPSKRAKELLKPLIAARELLEMSLITGSSLRDIVEINYDELKKLTASDQADLYALIGQAIKGDKAMPRGVGVLPSGAHLRRRDSTGLIDQTLLDLETKEIENIARLFNLSARYLGVSGNIRVELELQNQTEDLLNITLSPYIRSIEDALTRLLPEGQYVKLDLTEIAKGTMIQRAEIATTLTAGRLMTREEARKYLGLSETPVGEMIEMLPGQMPNDAAGGDA